MKMHVCSLVSRLHRSSCANLLYGSYCLIPLNLSCSNCWLNSSSARIAKERSMFQALSEYLESIQALLWWRKRRWVLLVGGFTKLMRPREQQTVLQGVIITLGFKVLVHIPLNHCYSRWRGSDVDNLKRLISTWEKKIAGRR